MDNERDTHYLDAGAIHSVGQFRVCSFLILLAEHHQQTKHVPLLSVLRLPAICISATTPRADLAISVSKSSRKVRDFRIL